MAKDEEELLYRNVADKKQSQDLQGVGVAGPSIDPVTLEKLQTIWKEFD